MRAFLRALGGLGVLGGSRSDALKGLATIQRRLAAPHAKPLFAIRSPPTHPQDKQGSASLDHGGHGAHAAWVDKLTNLLQPNDALGVACTEVTEEGTQAMAEGRHNCWRLTIAITGSR